MSGPLAMFADLAIRSTLLILFAWGVTALMRKAGASAAMRHLVWLCVLAGLFLLPLLMVMMPALPVAILPEAAPPPPPPPPLVPVPATAADVAPALTSAEPASATPDVLLTIYVAIAGGMLAMLLSAQRALSAMWRAASPAGSGWAGALSEAAGDLQLRGRIELRLAGHSVMPMTWGTLVPKILLPAEARDWTPARRRFVLLHELAHVRRRDSLTQAFAAVVRALWWFQPGAWFAVRQLRLEQELAADDLALGAGAPASGYARNLLELACAYCLPAPAMASRSQLEHRLVAIVQSGSRRARGPAFGAVAASLVFAATWLSATAMPVEGVTAAPATRAPREFAPAPAAAIAAVQIEAVPPRLGPPAADAPPTAPTPAAALPPAEPVAMAPVRSVESRNGVHVTVRYGQAQRIEVVSGAPKLSVDANGRLTIDNHGRPHRERASVAIVTQRIDALSVAEGGRLTVEGGFPRQGAISAAVANGGTLDLRRLPVDEVSAAVSQGGRIAVTPARQLSASVNQGGNITYWGEPQVTSAIQHGGVVQRGRADEIEEPF